MVSFELSINWSLLWFEDFSVLICLRQLAIGVNWSYYNIGIPFPWCGDIFLSIETVILNCLLEDIIPWKKFLHCQHWILESHFFVIDVHFKCDGSIVWYFMGMYQAELLWCKPYFCRKLCTVQGLGLVFRVYLGPV